MAEQTVEDLVREYEARRRARNAAVRRGAAAHFSAQLSGQNPSAAFDRLAPQGYGPETRDLDPEKALELKAKLVDSYAKLQERLNDAAASVAEKQKAKDDMFLEYLKANLESKAKALQVQGTVAAAIDGVYGDLTKQQMMDYQKNLEGNLPVRDLGAVQAAADGLKAFTADDKRDIRTLALTGVYTPTNPDANVVWKDLDTAYAAASPAGRAAILAKIQSEFPGLDVAQLAANVGATTIANNPVDPEAFAQTQAGLGLVQSDLFYDKLRARLKGVGGIDFTAAWNETKKLVADAEAGDTEAVEGAISAAGGPTDGSPEGMLTNLDKALAQLDETSTTFNPTLDMVRKDLFASQQFKDFKTKTLQMPDADDQLTLRYLREKVARDVAQNRDTTRKAIAEARKGELAYRKATSETKPLFDKVKAFVAPAERPVTPTASPKSVTTTATQGDTFNAAAPSTPGVGLPER